MRFHHPVFKSRLILLLFFYSILGIILIIRLIQLQLIHGHDFEAKSKRNIVAYLYEPSLRGNILDRNRTPLTENKSAWDLYFQNGSKKQLKTTIEELLNISQDPFLKTALKRSFSQPAFEPLLLIKNLSLEQMGSLAYLVYQKPYLKLKHRIIREYPFDESFAHLLGYTQPVQVMRFIDEEADNERPIMGIEKEFHSYLKGKSSKILIEKNAQQKMLGTSTADDGKKGQDLILTIDHKLQTLAYKILKNYQIAGAIVAIDTKSGEILAATSYPSFSPEKIRNDPSIYAQQNNQPMFNRAFNGLYPPASLVKPILGIAALEEALITKDTMIFDPGFFELEGSKKRYHDWKKNGHGYVNLSLSIAESCDTFFYKLGIDLGIEKMSQWFNLFGLGKNFELGLPHKTGIVPTKEWKLSALKEPWYKGESIVTAIGQGYLSATPLHLAYTAALIGSKGKTPQPTLIKGSTKILPSDKFKEITSWELIHDAMDMVISYKQGTAHKRLNYLKLPIAGKTGTAQVVSHNKSEGSLNAAHKDHSLFMAFAPKDNPSLAIVVIIEHEQYATEIAGKFLKEVFSRNLLPTNEDKIELITDRL